MDPNNADAHNGKGVALTHKREYAEAVERFQSALRLDPATAGYHINLAIVYHLQGEREDALREYRRAVQLDPATRDQVDIFSEP
jgi:Flp pilus assembly protein TadD